MVREIATVGVSALGPINHLGEDYEEWMLSNTGKAPTTGVVMLCSEELTSSSNEGCTHQVVGCMQMR